MNNIRNECICRAFCAEHTYIVILDHGAEEKEILMAHPKQGKTGTRPLICVTPRWFPAHEIFCAGESIGDIFMNALLDVGGMPVMMPVTSDKGLMREYVAMCDGFTFPGGHNVDSTKWGEDPIDINMLCPERDALELPLLELILEADKPFLGICRGAQVLNVVLGGTLEQDLTRLKPQGREHLWSHTTILDRSAHPVEVEEGSLLQRCVGGKNVIEVNSSHGQCVGKLGEGVHITGRATDGIVEAFEVPSQRYCLGVQWHPEYTWQLFEHDRQLFGSLVEAASKQ